MSVIQLGGFDIATADALDEATGPGVDPGQFDDLFAAVAARRKVEFGEFADEDGAQ